MSHPPTRRLYAFDAMRGVAAILVMLYHAGRVGPSPSAHGYVAVDLFFALSGAVIDQSYRHRLETTLSTREFVEKRIIRLYPIFLIGLVLGIIKSVGNLWLQNQPDLTVESMTISFLFNLFMLPSPLNIAEIFPLNGSQWSMFFELMVNILYATILFRLPTRSIVSIAFLAGVGIVATALQFGTLNIGWAWPTFSGGIFRSIYAFSAGVLINRLIRTRRIGTHIAFIPMILIVVMCCTPFRQGLGQTLDIVYALLLCPTLVACGRAFEIPSRFHRLAAFLGDISYPLYGIHFPLIFICTYLLRKIGLTGTENLLVFSVLVTAASPFVEKYYDAPLRLRLSKMTKIRESAPPRILS
ncbi:acyltransferase family protein [Gluconacetobacter tumulisoli]|uniref:Acyltransferase n=1 Tax=Gluconacetobacter tumulisoli TaxID=1286189 RepID=A0A7W4K5Y8_9PROT|nr:acyltransferase [Gluconacetobacter tumulisoli]MBB2201004.1 acyltransferase [Gluconacetobacter tumulisoli]